MTHRYIFLEKGEFGFCIEHHYFESTTLLNAYLFLFLNSIVVYGYTAICLLIHLLIDIWVVFKDTSLCIDVCFLFSWIDTKKQNGWVIE